MTKQDELVSIIVPVYNMEKHLKRCINSILSQTYTQLEIILVDDGSTDGSGDLCDIYAANDARVYVYHKANGGQSEARNTGLSHANGEYIAFVDADDYVSHHYIEYLYYDIKKYEADIACCKSVEVSKEQIVFTESKQSERVLRSMDAVIEMLYGQKLTVSLCSKLYRKSLFENICFPVGFIYEDLDVVCKITAKAEKVVCSKDISYCYYVHAGSTVHSLISERHMIAFTILEEHSKYFQPGNRQLSAAIDCQYMILCMEFLKNGLSSPELKDCIWCVIKKKRWRVFWNIRSPLRIRMFALLSIAGERTTDMILKMYYNFEAA